MTADEREREREREGSENYFEQARSHFFGVQTGVAPNNVSTSTSHGSNTSSSSSGSSSSSSRVADGQPSDVLSLPNSLCQDSTRGSPFHAGDIPGMQNGNSINPDESPKTKGYNEFSSDRDRDGSSEKKRKNKLQYVNYVKTMFTLAGDSPGVRVDEVAAR